MSIRARSGTGARSDTEMGFGTGASTAGAAEVSFPPPGSTVHLIGVGGAGMSAIARVLVSLGYEVTGSDLRESGVIARLRSIGVDCAIGHHPCNVVNPEAVIYSAAVRPSNPELRAAIDRGIPTFKRTDAVAHISRLKKTISVAGTHGKTSTSSMLALVLAEAGFDPSFMVGAELNETGTNARWSEGEWQVLEADESDGTFLRLQTEIAVVTNVDRDHLENWSGSFDRLKEGFETFMSRAETVVANRSDATTAELCERIGVSESPSRVRGVEQHKPRAAFFGEGRGPGVCVRTLEVSEAGTLAEFRVPGLEKAERVRLPLIGRHFAVNAAAVVAVARELDIEFDAVRRGLEAFEGVERRMVLRGEVSGVAVYDDYAHTPAEVAATIEAGDELASKRGGKLIAVFQPHLYTRTSLYCAEFARALSSADAVYVTEVYGSREDPIPGVSGRLVADEAKRTRGSPPVYYLPSRRQLIEQVAAAAHAGDVVVTMGAGDITSAVPLLLDALRNEGRQRPGEKRES